MTIYLNIEAPPLTGPRRAGAQTDPGARLGATWASSLVNSTEYGPSTSSATGNILPVNGTTVYARVFAGDNGVHANQGFPYQAAPSTGAATTMVAAPNQDASIETRR